MPARFPSFEKMVTKSLSVFIHAKVFEYFMVIMVMMFYMV